MVQVLGVNWLAGSPRKSKKGRSRAVLSLFFLGFVATPAAGQSVHGRIMAQGDTIGVGGAELSLFDFGGTSLLRVISDSLGTFRIAAPEAGRYEILATRLGFGSVRAEVEVGERELVEVVLRMTEEAIPLDPIVVVARREIRRGTLDEFYDRMGRNQQRGVGWFFTREEIEQRERIRLPFLLNTAPGVFLSGSGESVQMRRLGEYCSPVVFVDGFETNYRELQLMDMEGIEIYKGRWENVEGYFPSECGMIFLWRRPDWGNPFNWGRVFLAGGLLVILITLGTLL